MRRLSLSAFLLLQFLGVLAGAASADYIDFSVMPKSEDAILTYGGGDTPLSAVGLATTGVTGQGTRLNDGVTVPLPPETYLQFVTGNFTKKMDNGWEFDKGGKLKIFTSGAAGPAYFTGTFNAPVDVIDTGNGVFKVLAGSIRGSAGDDLGKFFGFDPKSQYTGGVSLLFDTHAKPGEAFSTSHVNSGNLALHVPSVSVPEPPVTVLLGAGGLVLGAFRYLRHAL